MIPKSTCVSYMKLKDVYSAEKERENTAFCTNPLPPCNHAEHSYHLTDSQVQAAGFTSATAPMSLQFIYADTYCS